MKKLIFLLAAIVFLIGATAFNSNAQVSLKSPYSLTSDTVTNTGTAYLSTSYLQPSGAPTLIWVAVTKISGTVGGTISLQGSIDGTNWKALNTPDSQTALATITATDATNTYHWRLAHSHFTYYRVTWTGTGTMSASFTAKILRSRL